MIEDDVKKASKRACQTAWTKNKDANDRKTRHNGVHEDSKISRNTSENGN